MNRALRAAIMGAALLSPVALSACSAGQVTQTASQVRDKTGAMAEVGDLSLRQVQLVYPRGGSYDAGDDAEVTLSIVNSGAEADALTAVDGKGFGSAEISGTSPDVSSAGDPVGTVPVATSDEITLPADTTVFVGTGDLTLTLTDLDEPLTVGQYVTLVFTFENAGEVTVRATVATPSRALERGEDFNFHDEEKANEAN